MAIVTGDLYKGFTFGGISSKAYGVYITQEAAYNAPDRDVEVVEIAGRNGAYILDKGRYKNITVSYKCGIALGDEQSFENAIRVFRNALASEAGKYVRLEDEYNPNEYRQAAFLGGIDVNMTDRRAGEFTVSFDAKPQRFLKSGETAVTIGGDVTNPQTKSGSIVSIEGTGADKVTSLVAQIEPVQAGSGDPSPTNVRPITGFDTVNIKKCSSLLKPSAVRTETINGITFQSFGDGSYRISGTSTAIAYCPILPIEQFAWPSDSAYSIYLNNNVGTDNASVYFFDGTTRIDYWTCAVENRRIVLPQPSLTGKNCNGIRLYVKAGVTIDMKLAPIVSKAPTTTPVPLGQTVYGGTVDVVTGVLTVTHQMDTYTGDSVTSVSSASGVQFAHIVASHASTGVQTAMKCDRYTPSSVAASGHITWVSATQQVVRIFDSRFTDAATAKSILNENPVHYCYPLTTPQTYALTAQQVELLTGNNKVWADTGDITITWGDDPNKLVNPTLYDAHPLLSFTASGSGTITINSDTIEVTNQPIGDIILANVTKLASGESVTWSDTGRYQTGDAIRIDSIPAVQTTVVMDSYSYANYTNYISDDMDYLSTASTARGIMIQHSIPSPPQFVAGTARSVSYTARVIDKVKHKTTGDIVDCTTNLTVTIAYDGAHSITATTTVTASLGTASTTVTIDTVTVNSTKSSLTGTAYIDLDIGEAYSIDGGAVVSINDSVSLGASLPVLKPSNNTISKTGAVANLTIIPRWWEL